MIVEDKIASLHKANEVSAKLIKIIVDEIKDFVCIDDPSEQIYLTVHIAGNLVSKICMSLEGYGNIYGINNMHAKSIASWINKIADEHILNYEEFKKGI